MKDKFIFTLAMTATVCVLGGLVMRFRFSLSTFPVVLSTIGIIAIIVAFVLTVFDE